MFHQPLIEIGIDGFLIRLIEDLVAVIGIELQIDVFDTDFL